MDGREHTGEVWLVVVVEVHKEGREGQRGGRTDEVSK